MFFFIYVCILVLIIQFTFVQGMTKPSKKPLSKKSKDRLNTFQKPSKKHFKPLQKSNGAMLEDVQPIHLQNDVPDFLTSFKTSITLYKIGFQCAYTQVFMQDFVFRLQEITQHTQVILIVVILSYLHM